MRTSHSNSPTPEQRFVGLDIGAAHVKVCVSARNDSEPQLFSVPTAISYSPPSAEPIHFSCIGDSAIKRRDHLQLFHPLHSEVEDRGGILGDFANHLRNLYHRRRDPNTARGVISCSATASESKRSLLRMISNEIFERVVLVDDMFLVAFATGSEAIRLHSVIIDIGYTSVRAGLVHGTAPTAAERVESGFGSNRLGETFKEMLRLRYSELQLTDHTVERLKTQLAFVSPANKKSILRIRYGGEELVVDATDLVHEATATLLGPLLQVARDILALCPSDEIAPFQRNILLVGGGAAIPGLAQRMEQELHADGFEFAHVVAPPDPESLVARGAYLWAQRMREEEWEIPLFSFAESDGSTL